MKAMNTETIITDEGIKPVYCRNCRGRDSFVRYPEKDILSDTGKLMWRKWLCKACGKEVIYPVASRSGVYNE